MNRKLLTEASALANILDKSVINNCFTFDFDRSLGLGDSGMITDSLYLMDRDTLEKIKIWEQEYDG